MKNKLSKVEHEQWEKRLSALGEKYDVTLQLAEVIGKRWSYLAGPTASTAGLMGMIREEIGNDLGIIIFPHSRAFTPSAKDQLMVEIL